ncbi:MAG: ABC transporter ATP-binding protein [Candidatus Stahlbacteria bacterium]|nr:ABC transporter ATP-binding protein [Candidatus Stahlbacteria bacterium]
MNNKLSTLHTIRRFLGFLKPYWKKGVIAFFFMLLGVGLQLPMPFLTKYLIDKVIVLKSFKILNIIGFVLIGVLFVRASSVFIQSFLLTTFGGRVLFDIRIKLFAHIQKLSLSFFHKKETGYLMSRLSGDVDAVHGLLADTLVSFVQSTLTFIAGVACTIYIHPKLACICFGILPFYLLSLQIFNKRIRNMSHNVREKYALVQKDLQELLSAVSLIKAFTGEKRATLRQLRSVKEAVRQNVRLDITATLASISSVIISSAGPVVLIWYGCREIMIGSLTVGGLIAFNSFIRYLFDPARSLFNLNISIQQSLAACERIFEMLDVAPERGGEKDIKIKEGKVIFQNVSFSYNGEEKVLDNISFEATPNETIAIVGRSGVGKTTLVSLIPRFYDPQNGKILIDGEDISNATISSLRKNIGIVAQETFLFSDTIKENIKFGNPNAEAEKIEEAANLAFAAEFIQKLPYGYDTKVGERGVNLSGGERQRIAIARVIVKNPKLLIFDEATSNLDSESERLIQNALAPLIKERTTFIIAHRLSTIRNADKIIVLDNHKIVGEGKHQELYENCPVYKELYDKQFLTSQ